MTGSGVSTEPGRVTSGGSGVRIEVTIRGHCYKAGVWAERKITYVSAADA